MRPRLAWVVAGVLLAASAPASADDNLTNWLVGPVFGLRLGGRATTSHLVLGFEGGGGYGPERFNVGFEHRDAKDFAYAEIDPWYLVGGTLGFGVDSDGEVQPVVGVWEGLPISGSTPCDGWHREVTVSAGYRYTGVHELYISFKAGRMNGNVCFD